MRRRVVLRMKHSECGKCGIMNMWKCGSEMKMTGNQNSINGQRSTKINLILKIEKMETLEVKKDKTSKAKQTDPETIRICCLAGSISFRKSGYDFRISGRCHHADL